MAVTSTNNLRKGMKDSNGSTDVLDLQKALNATGKYNLALDGSYGGQTDAAVRDFQKNNGLKVDGIVGTNTWGALTNASKSSAQTQTPAQTAAPTFNPTQSDATKQKWADYEAFKTQKPGEYNKTWYDTLQETINQINNREKFSYDLNGDMLYQQYKDQYTTQGKLASMDVMGQAAAMNGGYGNSYAQTAGQQAYQGYLQQLNDKVPELYQLALNQYNQEGQALYDKANLLGQMDETEWNRNQTELNNYYKELGVLFDDAKYTDDTEYNRGVDKYNADYTGYWDQTKYDYQVDRDKVADQQWQATFDEGVRQYNKSFDEQKRQYNLSLQQKKDEVAAKEQKEWDDAVKAAADDDDVKEFVEKMNKDTQYWDAVMRHKYGSEKTYIAQMIENGNFTEAEEAYLIGLFEITDSDTHYKK